MIPFQFLYACVKKNSVQSLTILFLFFSIFASNNKYFIVLSILYYCAVFLAKRSFEQTILYCFIPFLTFSYLGKTYVEELVPITSLYGGAASGIYSIFILSPFSVLLLTSFICLPIFIQRYRRLSIDIPILLFFFFGFIGIFSSYSTEYLPAYSITIPLVIIGTVTWALLCRTYITHLSYKRRQEIYKILYYQLFIIILFQIIIIFLQIIKSSSLGLWIEQYSFSFHESPDTVDLLYKFRPFGLSAHPNLMAYQLVDMFCCFILLHFFIYKKICVNIYLFIVMCLIFVSVIFSQSRAAYIASLFLYTSFCWYYRIAIKKWLYIISLQISMSVKLLLKYMTIVLFAIIFTFIVFPRLQNTRNSMVESGGWNFREKFNKEAWDLIIQHPILGVGPGMFVAANLQIHPFGVNYSFPYEVHNHFFLLIAEFGIPAFFCYVGGFFFTFRILVVSKKITLFTFCVILSLSIIAFFHALERALPLTVVLLMAVPFYVKNIKKNN